MNERIRYIRENEKLSRIAFGQRIGVSGDVVNNLERGRVEIKDHIIKLVCSEFSVSEDWLRNGIEPMYIEPDTFSLDEFVHKNGMTALELEIFKTYFELDPEIRKAVVGHFKNRLTASLKDVDDTTATALADDTVENAEAAYIKSRSNIVQKKDLSVLNTTADIPKEKEA